MENSLISLLKKDTVLYTRFLSMVKQQSIPAKTVLLRAGEIAQHLYIVKEGCMRLCFNHDGNEVTFQFFFEEMAVASIESFTQESPSLFTLESIEPTTLWCCKRSDFMALVNESPQLTHACTDFVLSRLINYSHLFLSRITDTPAQRYEKLVTDHPEIIQRVAQHYIASYLGITAVSLSRIRNRR